jgi:uncharacterized protein YifE (UPF0438 family)
VSEPEQKQNNDKRDVAVCRGIPELRVIFEVIWKAYKSRSDAANNVS